MKRLEMPDGEVDLWQKQNDRCMVATGDCPKNRKANMRTAAGNPGATHQHVFKS